MLRNAEQAEATKRELLAAYTFRAQAPAKKPLLLGMVKR